MSNANNSDRAENNPDQNESGIQTYLNEVSKHKLLSNEETIRLARKIKETDDKSAIEKLITANLRLVITIAMDYRQHWMDDFLDLVQEGNIGLAKAVRKFDPDKNVKFSYYASFWIKAYIMKYTMENKRLIKIGTTQNQRKLFFALDKEIRKFEANGESPEPKEIARNLQVDERDVIEMTQRLKSSEVSLNTPLNSWEPRCLGDTLSSEGQTVEDIVTTKEEMYDVRQILLRHGPSFNDREQAIIDQRLLNDDSATLKCIAEQFQLSKERVRQIEMGLYNKLQNIFEREMPDRVAA